MLRIHSLYSRVVAICLASFALSISPVSAQTTPLADVTIEFDSGPLDLDAEVFARYETEFVDDELDFMILGRRGFDDTFSIGFGRIGELWGLPFYGGLGSVTDPVSKENFYGLVLAVKVSDGDRSKIHLGVYDDSLVRLTSVVLHVSPAPEQPIPPPANPFFADSVGPVGHLNSAQTDSTGQPGPVGQVETLTGDDLTYTFAGPARFGIAISPPYPGGKRVIWSNGGDRITKVNYDDLSIIAELQIAGSLMDEATAESRVEAMDAASGEDLALVSFGYAAVELAGLAGVYYALDADNTLFVGGADSIIAYGDAVPGSRMSGIVIKDEWQKPAEIGGRFAGANLTFDGKLCLVTDEGWVVVAERDFSSYEAIRLEGSVVDGVDVAAEWNALKAAEGFRAGAADWVRNSAAIDEDGGIYIPSLEHMHKVIWNGTTLSTDPADGAWVVPYSNTKGLGSGATPSLMGFGDEDKFVVITDGDILMNVMLFWRDGIPGDWVPLPGHDPRIAGIQPADFGDPAVTEVQSEQSVIVGGYGTAVVNNEPPNDPPPPIPLSASTLLVGYAGNDPLYTPHGIHKMEWNPSTRTFEDAWVQQNVSSTNGVPIVSTRSNLMYTVGARNGDWTMEAIDWITGDSAFHWVTGSSRYNTRYSGLFLDQEGRVIHTTTYGILRYER